MSHILNSIKLHDGNAIPQMGFGVWQVENDIVADTVKTAINTGYRLIDTAAIYGNESGVGEAIRDCGRGRRELFITTKLWNDRHGYDETLAAFDESMQKLGLEYIDLYLIHWPAPKIGLYVKSWEALIRLRDEGRIKSIGVSNFNIGHLQRLLDETGVLPVVNQIELNPRFQQPELRQYHAEHNIVTESWSPLGHGLLWDNPVLAGIAAKHKRSLAQVVLRWHTQLGNVVIPKSITPERIRENFHIFDFKLDADDLAAIAAMHDEGARHGPDPERFRLPKAS
ncbi:aldo/keto reductase [Pusillimonas noertemannii]|uniref:Diketogulonate reductase-like aldo/keto reductase n=1 Tax=Pusillimonas noertemannii TaxID=305977 RepID=A0A2U1CNC4_9BURK|nr:aldo/keto reductase [Pusillimonas noertemannii]NYT68470.1 aldo/keto reductase [Pusillimonas noertemannii]PVY62513.1 diketogulonate reductase-like aldo/keto reductase [Pusillimonas noertemannii]TFL10533.1 aldo/keto reductase [Pusillimonas noertemannii]